MGKHHKKRVATAARMAIVPSAAAAVMVAASGAASAVPDQLPSQGGVTSAPSTQGGVTEAAPSRQGGVTSVPAQPEPVYWVEPPAEYRNVQYQPLENYDYDTDTYTTPAYVAPIQVQDLHLPVQVEPTAPIIAPRETLRIGTFHAPQPNWITDGDLARTNNTSAIVEAQVTTFWRSIGVETTRANRLAAAQLGMGVGGALMGAAGYGLPAALLGGAAGTNAAVTGLIATPADEFLPVIGFVSGVTVATAVGAAALGVPAAIAGGVTGAALGTIAGYAFGAGDLGEPRDLPIPDVDEPAIAAQTQETLAQWESTPAGTAVASAIRDTAAAAPEIDRQAREFVAARPGGQQLLDAIDTGLSTFVADSSVGTAAHMISAAIGDGIQA